MQVQAVKKLLSGDLLATGNPVDWRCCPLYADDVLPSATAYLHPACAARLVINKGQKGFHPLTILPGYFIGFNSFYTKKLQKIDIVSKMQFKFNKSSQFVRNILVFDRHLFSLVSRLWVKEIIFTHLLHHFEFFLIK